MGEARVERRLAAVLAADIAGYSRLMGADEVGTLRAIRTLRHELVDPAVAFHRGRVVKTTGDGVLVEFASVLAAVSCAIDVQRGLRKSNETVQGDKKLVLRVGINIGEILVEDGDIFGDGVNIAARLETLCEPGSICISRAAHDEIRDRLPLSFSSLGERALKNIARPVEVYCLTASDIAAIPDTFSNTKLSPVVDASPDAGRPIRIGDSRPTVAVLPFDNLGKATEVDEFCDGLAEDTITALSKFRWLNIVSRNSSFTLKGRAADIRQVARDLSANFMLEGSVRKSDRRIRITAQLIDGISGNHIWADRYDRDYIRLFELQDEITRDIVAALEYVLWAAMAHGNTHAGPPDPELTPLRAAAWHVIECSHASNRTAIACATNALKKNPKSIAAYQYLANVYVAELQFGWAEDPDADLESFLTAARRATSLDPADALSEGLYSGALAFSEKYEEASAGARRALALNPNSANVLGPCATVLSLVAQPREANEMFKRMLRLVPAHYFRGGSLSQMALNSLQLSDPGQAIDFAVEAVKLKPEALSSHLVHARALDELGRTDEAKTSLLRAHRQRPNLDERVLRRMFPHRDRSVFEGIAGML